jgi:hypothetical protein
VTRFTAVLTPLYCREMTVADENGNCSQLVQNGQVSSIVTLVVDQWTVWLCGRHGQTATTDRTTGDKNWRKRDLGIGPQYPAVFAVCTDLSGAVQRKAKITETNLVSRTQKFEFFLNFSSLFLNSVVSVISRLDFTHRFLDYLLLFIPCQSS